MSVIGMQDRMYD